MKLTLKGLNKSVYAKSSYSRSIISGLAGCLCVRTAEVFGSSVSRAQAGRE